MCDKLTLSRIICPNPCPDGGASIETVKVERADNSLGWTDPTLTAKQTRGNISAFDLSKALYLDEILVKATGVQNMGNVVSASNAGNLYLRMDIDRAAEGTNADKLKALEITITIRHGGQTYAKTLPATTAATTSSNETTQTFIWDLSSAIPPNPGRLKDGDTFEAVARYEVITNTLKLNEIQTGKQIYFYNVINGAEKYCNYLTPEMYLIAGQIADGANTVTPATGCNLFTPGNSTNYYAYRFNAAASPYIYEVRPGVRYDKYTVVVPVGYALSSVKMNNPKLYRKPPSRISYPLSRYSPLTELSPL